MSPQEKKPLGLFDGSLVDPLGQQSKWLPTFPSPQESLPDAQGHPEEGKCGGGLVKGAANQIADGQPFSAGLASSCLLRQATVPRVGPSSPPPRPLGSPHPSQSYPGPRPRPCSPRGPNGEPSRELSPQVGAPPAGAPRPLGENSRAQLPKNHTQGLLVVGCRLFFKPTCRLGSAGKQDTPGEGRCCVGRTRSGAAGPTPPAPAGSPKAGSPGGSCPRGESCLLSGLHPHRPGRAWPSGWESGLRGACPPRSPGWSLRPQKTGARRPSRAAWSPAAAEGVISGPFPTPPPPAPGGK